MQNKKFSIKNSIAVVLVLALTSALVLFNYHFDNKYTADGVQPVRGILSLSETDLQKTKTMFLIREWQFYPNVLLTPNDFQGKTPNAYMQYVNIGQYGAMNQGNNQKSTVNSATYRLILSLPETERTYSLALPEVFSAYRLYIGGEPMLTMGNPDPDNFQQLVQNRTVTFSGCGTTELLLAVTNTTHFYDGLVYPPAFGTPESVNHMWTLQLIFSGIAVALALFITLFSIYFYFRLKQKNALIYIFLCLCMVGYTCYALLHSFVSVGVQPWYSLELFFTYVLYWLIVHIQNQICLVSRTARKASQVFAAAFCAFVFVFSAFSPHSEFILRDLFSWFVIIYKWIITGYLIAISLIAVRKNIENSFLLLLATTIFGITIAADRLLPVYEPIYGGWFPEWGAVLLVVTLGIFLWKDLIEAYYFRLSFIDKERQMKRQIALLKHSHEQLAEKIDETKVLRHNQRQHLTTLHTLVGSGEITALKEYLECYDCVSDVSEPIIFCKNLIADAILKYYSGLAKQNEIDFSIAFSMPKQVGIQDTDLSILLGNLLENALEATMHQNNLKRFIKVKAGCKNNKFVCQIQNAFDGTIRTKGDRFLSTKATGSGIGIKSVKTVVAKYMGLVDFSVQENLFIATLSITID